MCPNLIVCVWPHAQIDDLQDGMQALQKSLKVAADDFDAQRKAYEAESESKAQADMAIYEVRYARSLAAKLLRQVKGVMTCQHEGLQQRRKTETNQEVTLCCQLS